MPNGYADVDAIRSALVDVDYPADKQTLVERASANGADEDTVKALRALPLADYDNVGEVIRSADLDPAAAEGQTPHDKAQQARSGGRPGIAEHLRDA
jgi:hypothetical protein